MVDEQTREGTCCVRASGIARNSDGCQDGKLDGADSADSESQIVSGTKHSAGMKGGKRRIGDCEPDTC